MEKVEDERSSEFEACCDLEGSVDSAKPSKKWSRVVDLLGNNLGMHHMIDMVVLWASWYSIDHLLVKRQCDEFRHGFVEFLVCSLHLLEVVVVVALSSAQTTALVVESDSRHNDEV